MLPKLEGRLSSIAGEEYSEQQNTTRKIGEK
jgi:hypothetical protein